MNDADAMMERLASAAAYTVKRAEAGDVNAATDIIAESVVGLRGWLELDERPLPHRLIYLRALLSSLERIDQGVDPSEALHLQNPAHRVADPEIGIRNVFLFVMVGQEFDRLTQRGQTRGDKPIAAAIRAVSKKTGASEETVQKAWSNYGALKGWEESRPDWK